MAGSTNFSSNLSDISQNEYTTLVINCQKCKCCFVCTNFLLWVIKKWSKRIIALQSLYICIPSTKQNLHDFYWFCVKDCKTNWPIWCRFWYYLPKLFFVKVHNNLQTQSLFLKFYQLEESLSKPLHNCFLMWSCS